MFINHLRRFLKKDESTLNLSTLLKPQHSHAIYKLLLAWQTTSKNALLDSTKNLAYYSLKDNHIYTTNFCVIWDNHSASILIPMYYIKAKNIGRIIFKLPMKRKKNSNDKSHEISALIFC